MSADDCPATAHYEGLAEERDIGDQDLVDADDVNAGPAAEVFG